MELNRTLQLNRTQPNHTPTYMRTRALFACLAFLSLVISTRAATRYVDASGSNPMAPFTNWATAASTIQQAIDAATAGDEILVTNGVYQTGARAVYGMSNRVALIKPVTVRSVNGPSVTQIVGYQVPGTTNGAAAIRCVYLANGAVLSGFTLTNGATQTSGGYYTSQSGGGVWCEGSNAVVSNCVLTGNSAYENGGGVYSGTLNNCTLTGNWANYYGGGAFYVTLNNCTLEGNSARSEGGGAYYSTLNNCMVTGNSAHDAPIVGASGGGTSRSVLNNCTITGNSADNGGGTSEGTLNNCIVYYNHATFSGDNYNSGAFNYCCTTPLPDGTGNLAQEPQLTSVSHLSAGSPCIGRGSAVSANGVDLDGEPWANPPSIGCDEYWSGPMTGALSVTIVAAYTNVATGFTVDFRAMIGGRVSISHWDFGDGSVVSNRPYASHTWAVAGDYVVELRAYNESHPAGVVAAVTVHVVHAENYVALTSANPVPPYSSWATAATNIQDAVDAALPGAVVWVSNGVYQTGARAVYGTSNRVAVTKPMMVRSINGPMLTQIVGYQVPGTANGTAAVRCAYLTNGAVLSGFTLTNGATQISGATLTNQSGGGVWCEGPGAVVSNCVLAGNSAKIAGGGAYNGTLNNCVISGNSARGGGGAFCCVLNNCTLAGNSASNGGGAVLGTLSNCTITGNSANNGGGAYSGMLNNCIVYYNHSIFGNDNYSSGTFNYCCTTPLPDGTGNLAEEPQLASASHLSAGSPCIGRGSATYASGVDIDGEPWANPPSIGCDEHWSGSLAGAPSVEIAAAYTNAAPGFAVDFQAVIGGRADASRWDFGDGIVASNRPYASHAWSATGDYVVELRAYNGSYPAGVAATVTVHVLQEEHYVALTSANPAPPYSSWATAATNIQDAVDVATSPGYCGFGKQRCLSNGSAGSVWDEQPGGGEQTRYSAERQRAGGDPNRGLSGAWNDEWRCRGSLCVFDQRGRAFRLYPDQRRNANYR